MEEIDWNERIKMMRTPEQILGYGCPICKKKRILGLLKEPADGDPNIRLRCNKCGFTYYWTEPATNP